MPPTESAPLISPHNDSTALHDASDIDEDYEFSRRPSWKKASVFWMLPPYLLFTTAFGGAMVPKINLILALICYRNMPETSDRASLTLGLPPLESCRTAAIQAKVSEFMMISTLITGLLSAIATPRIGALSDRYGRTRVIVTASMGMIVGEVLSIVLAHNPDTFSVYFLILGYIFDGLTGSFTGAMVLAHSYAADCTPPQKRTVAFGYFHGCLSMGIAIGPMLASIMIKRAGGSIIPVLYATVIAHVIFILAMYFIVPESLPRSKQLAARERHRIEKQERRQRYKEEDAALVAMSHDDIALPSVGTFSRIRTSFLSSRHIIRTRRYLQQTFLAPLEILRPKGPGTTPALRRNLIVMVVMDAAIMGILMGMTSIMITYLTYRFGWSSVESSMFVSIISLVKVISLVIGLPVLTTLFQKRAGANSISLERHTGAANGRPNGTSAFDLSVIRISLIAEICAYFGYAISWSGLSFVMFGCLGAVGFTASAILQSALTNHVAPENVGKLLGASGLLHSLSRIVAPFLFNFVYAVTIGKPGLSQSVFIFLGLGFVVMFVSSLVLRPNVHIPGAIKLDTLPEGESPRYSTEAPSIVNLPKNDPLEVLLPSL